LSSSDDRVVHFPTPEAPVNPITLVPKAEVRFCSHDVIQLDEHQRQVTCAQCAAVLDPFEFLRTNAHVIQRAWAANDEMRRMTADITARVAALKKEETRLRAMVKRLQEKTAPIVIRKGGPL
jgi:hypothetical protein